MIVGYTMLHYGTDYLAYALQSLAPYVDKHVILYSATPSFGSATQLHCPDSRDDLFAIADRVLGEKLVWYDGLPQNYTTVKAILPDTRLILEVDADEIWPPSLIASVLRRFRSANLMLGPYRMPMIHHWRSFFYACSDGSWPVRMFVGGGLENAHWKTIPTSWPYDGAPINHFGYARSIEDTRYKVETSAHKGEWRRGWFDNVFLRFPERLKDLHPVTVDFWNAEPYDRGRLPDFMQKHPWYDREVIE